MSQRGLSISAPNRRSGAVARVVALSVFRRRCLRVGRLAPEAGETGPLRRDDRPCSAGLGGWMIEIDRSVKGQVWL